MNNVEKTMGWRSGKISVCSGKVPAGKVPAWCTAARNALFEGFVSCLAFNPVFFRCMLGLLAVKWPTKGAETPSLPREKAKAMPRISYPYNSAAIGSQGAYRRTIGWIGHSIEQYETNRLIRPRARYTGTHPKS